MQDRRFKYSLVERRNFYLFIRDKRSHIYYAKFPFYNNKTITTRKTTLKEAYEAAQRIYASLTMDTSSNVLWKDPANKLDKSHFNTAKKILNNEAPVLTLNSLIKIQKTLLSRGIAPQTINGTIDSLRRMYNGDFPTGYKRLRVESRIVRKSFPVKSCYGIYKKMDIEHNPIHRVIWIEMTTGMRLNEISTAVINGNYLQINGTKTINAVRRVPLLPETKRAIELGCIINKPSKEYVLEAARLIGLNETYIEDNNIVFHCFRRLYKSLLESAGVPNAFIEAWLGHSHFGSIDSTYFDIEAADDTLAYSKCIEALKRLVS